MIYRIAFLLGLLFVSPSFAADNATLITPCASGCVTMRSKDIGGGVQSMIQILGDISGNAIYGTAGTANANVLSIQGIASGTNVPVSIAAGLNANVPAADSQANVALSAPVTSFNELWNGSTWDRAPGTAAAGAQVNVKSGGFASGAVASGAFASGSIGSGAVASGAYASGAIASGAYASGSLASGAVVDITNISVATGAAPPSKAIYLGANASGATGGHVAGMIACDSHVFKHITSATDTLAVQGVASQNIYVCGWRSRAAGVATWFLENTASANANCSSSNTQITGLATEAANTGETMLAAFWSGLKNTTGNGLCVNSTGTGGVDVDIWYAQF